ncbi:unnamed protein product [Agarophyton chilense]
MVRFAPIWRREGDEFRCENSSASARLISSSVQRNMESTEEVLRWLRGTGMSQHLASFRAYAITGSSLVGLNSIELDKILGVVKLADRRKILEGIEYLRQVFSVESRRSIPEDGRILTHLSNERVFLSWVRFAVILQTVAIATVRLENDSKDSSIPFVLAVSVTVTVLAFLALVYGTYMYFWMQRLIESPGVEHIPENDYVTPPLFIGLSAAVAGLYAAMAIDAQTAAELVLIGA